MTKRVALYTRVSTSDGQTIENQLRDLHLAAERQGWTRNLPRSLSSAQPSSQRLLGLDDEKQNKPAAHHRRTP